MKDNFEYELSERDFLDAIYLRAKKNPYNIQEEWYKIIFDFPSPKYIHSDVTKIVFSQEYYDYLSYSKKYSQMGIIKFGFIFEINRIEIEIIPNFFIEYFREKYLSGSYLIPKQKTKKKNKIYNEGGEIKKMEILKQNGWIIIYINGNYNNGLVFRCRKYWGLMIELATNQYVDFDKGFLDYFNSNTDNPLYIKYKFKKSKILKVNEEKIIPLFKLNFVTQKKITQ